MTLSRIGDVVARVIQIPPATAATTTHSYISTGYSSGYNSGWQHLRLMSGQMDDSSGKRVTRNG